jgi:hypothetical protein
MMDIIQQLKNKRKKTQEELDFRNPGSETDSPIAKLLDAISPYDNRLRNQAKDLDERISFYEDILKWTSRYAGKRDWHIIDRKPWDIHEKTLMLTDGVYAYTFKVNEYLICTKREETAMWLGRMLGCTFAENS